MFHIYEEIVHLLPCFYYYCAHTVNWLLCDVIMNTDDINSYKVKLLYCDSKVVHNVNKCQFRLNAIAIMEALSGKLTKMR